MLMEESTLNPFDVRGNFTLQKNCLVQKFAKNRQEDDCWLFGTPMCNKEVGKEDGWMLHKGAGQKPW